MKKAKSDRNGSPIGDGRYHVDFVAYEFEEFPQVSHSISKSNTSETVYVNYYNSDNGKSVTVRFSWHTSNAVEFGDQLDGFSACEDSILYRLGLRTRTFVPDTFLSIASRKVKKKEMKDYEVADLTIQEMYSLGEGADLSEYKGKLASGDNYLILGNKVEKVERTKTNRLGQAVRLGHYIYEEL